MALGPTAEQLAQVGLSGWLQAQWSVVVALLAALTAIVVMTIWCARVLAAEPTELGALLTDAGWLSDAFSKYAVRQPYFLDSKQFLNADLECRTPDEDGKYDPRAGAVNDVSARISTLSADLNAKARFKTFAWVFGVGAVAVIGAALFTLGYASRTPQVINNPASVTLHIPTDELATVISAGRRISLSASEKG